MAINLSPSERLTYCTVRIKVDMTDKSTGTGTGYFYNFPLEGDKHVPVIVTNKHVVEGASLGSFQLHVGDGDGGVVSGKFVNVKLENFANTWIQHPENNIDLCIMPVGPLLEKVKAQGQTPFYMPLSPALIPSEQDLVDLNALEDIVMVGYPSGIWDSKNNMPIIRRGISATHPATDYEGRPEFMIDAACFPGSSGSPVFLFNQGSYAPKGGGIVMGSRIKLLGTLYAGPQFTATGEVKVIAVPTKQQVISESRIPLNLGLVIKANQLLAFDDLINRLLDGR